ncbi:MAG: type II secretion system protein [Synergistaceae bacterium]|nr:type II secretion system protein [Synergistaceae bacterium]
MKKFRKGFTLLELLVVIGVMGLMSSMAMIAGQQATDAARANNIADGLEKAASAMMMYYGDNSDIIAVEGIGDSTTIKIADLVSGASAYLKRTGSDEDEDMLIASTATNKDGKYYVDVQGTAPAQEWWIVYTIPATDIAGVGPILKNKANRMGLKTTSTSNAAYDGETATVAMKVRGKLAAAAGGGGDNP